MCPQRETFTPSLYLLRLFVHNPRKPVVTVQRTNVLRTTSYSAAVANGFKEP